MSFELGFAARHDSQLFTVSAYNADFGITNFSVDTSVRILVTNGIWPFLLTCYGGIIPNIQVFCNDNQSF